MPTAKHRIAAYLPPEVDEKFQVFKQEKGVGDSQALILILTEFLKVSREVAHNSSLDIEALKSELLGELLSELDNKFSELKSELLNSSPKTDVVGTVSPVENSDSLFKLLVSHELAERLTIAQLSERFGCDAALTRKQKSKYRDEPEKFIGWSKSRDPDGRGWQFDEAAKLFTPVDE
jgi:Asp-tRNA(Asn)/Glu-tRNA(Gln) amidotransferase B subunit